VNDETAIDVKDRLPHRGDQESECSHRSVVSLILGIPAFCVILLVRVYQLTLSKLWGPVCRFHPSCSHYFIGAVKKYGLIRGGWRGVKRILRCHPFHPGGYDPP